MYARTWERLEQCRLASSEFNDGDSFQVRHRGREYIFRLYHVDTPESKDLGLTERTTAQAKYFRVLKRDLYVAAAQAAAFTARHLRQPFTVHTRWEDARGQSQLPRYYAVVTTAEGGDLAAELVRAGLARIHGQSVGHPDGRSGRRVQEDLSALEAEARAQSRGIWAFSRSRSSAPAP